METETPFLHSVESSLQAQMISFHCDSSAAVYQQLQMLQCFSSVPLRISLDPLFHPTAAECSLLYAEIYSLTSAVNETSYVVLPCTAIGETVLALAWGAFPFSNC